MAKADKSHVVHIVYDESRYDTVTLEIVAQLERELAGRGLQCTYFEKDAPAGAQEIGQREHYLLNANWIIIVYSEPTELSSDMFIFEENMVMSEAVNRGELCVLFLIQPFMLNFNSRGFPSVVIQGTEWLDEVVKQVDQSPVQLTSTHFDDIEAYRKLYAELQKARNLTASDPLLYHRRSAHYGFPFSQIQALYFNFLSLISWSSRRFALFPTEPDDYETMELLEGGDQFPTQSNMQISTETRDSYDSPTNVDRRPKFVHAITQHSKSEDMDATHCNISTCSETQDGEDNSWSGEKVTRSAAGKKAEDRLLGVFCSIHICFLIEHCNTINFSFFAVIAVSIINSVLAVFLKRFKIFKVYFNDMLFFNTITFYVISLVCCLTSNLNTSNHLVIIASSTFTMTKLEPTCARSLWYWKLHLFTSVLFLAFVDFRDSSLDQSAVTGYTDLSNYTVTPDFDTCPTTSVFTVLKLADLFARFGYFQYASQCGRSLLSAAMYLCFKKNLTFVTKYWGIDVILYYCLYIKNSPCMRKIIVHVLKGS